ncbi:MAG: hypothetical protein WC682_02465 [Parcubacteria group bacterium]|jgi:hypothetical protein
MFNKENNKEDLISESIKSVKFHTMQDDLSGKNEISQEEETKNPIISDAKEDSPFLSGSKNISNKIDDVAVANKGYDNQDVAFKQPFTSSNNNVNDKDDIGGVESEINDEVEKKSHFFSYMVIFLIIILLGAGGYYYVVIKGENISSLLQNVNIINNDSSSDNSNTNIAETNPIGDALGNTGVFSDKTNFLVIGEDKFNQAGIKSVIDEKFLEMEKYKGNQLEFIVVDKNNKPVGFNEFINKFNLSLNAEIVNNLVPDNFSIFLYKKDNIKRMDMVIGIKNKDLLKIGLNKNEKTLVSDLSGLFIYEKPVNVIGRQFKDSKYKDSLIRYINLNTSLNLSLDYAISGDYLVLATNKDSGRLIIDKLASELVKNEDIFNQKK